MLIVALVLAVVGLAALVTAVVTSNELVAWVCIAASGLGVLLLIVDAIRDRQYRRQAGVEATADDAEAEAETATDYPEDEPAEEPPVSDDATPEEPTAEASDAESEAGSDQPEETANKKP